MASLEEESSTSAPDGLAEEPKSLQSCMLGVTALRACHKSREGEVRNREGDIREDTAQ
jgi:hypothetical protein